MSDSIDKNLRRETRGRRLDSVLAEVRARLEESLDRLPLDKEVVALRGLTVTAALGSSKDEVSVSCINPCSKAIADYAFSTRVLNVIGDMTFDELLSWLENPGLAPQNLGTQSLDEIESFLVKNGVIDREKFLKTSCKKAFLIWASRFRSYVPAVKGMSKNITYGDLLSLVESGSTNNEMGIPLDEIKSFLGDKSLL